MVGGRVHWFSRLILGGKLEEAWRRDGMGRAWMGGDGSEEVLSGKDTLGGEAWGALEYLTYSEVGDARRLPTLPRSCRQKDQKQSVTVVSQLISQSDE